MIISTKRPNIQEKGNDSHTHRHTYTNYLYTAFKIRMLQVKVYKKYAYITNLRKLVSLY